MDAYINTVLPYMFYVQLYTADVLQQLLISLAIPHNCLSTKYPIHFITDHCSVIKTGLPVVVVIID